MIRPIHVLALGSGALLQACAPAVPDAGEVFEPAWAEAPGMLGFDDADRQTADLGVPCVPILPFDFDNLLDFNATEIAPGTELTYAYACTDADGNPREACFPDLDVVITTTSRDGADRGCGLAFDTNNPTEGDEDLLTPNPAGPNNTTDLRNVLVKDEHHFGCVGNEVGIAGVDDDASGALFRFDFQSDFSSLYGVATVDVLDVELAEGDAQFRFYQEGACVAELVVGDDPGTGACDLLEQLGVDESQRGDSSRQEVPIGFQPEFGPAWSMEVELSGSGAIDMVHMCMFLGS